MYTIWDTWLLLWSIWSASALDYFPVLQKQDWNTKNFWGCQNNGKYTHSSVAWLWNPFPATLRQDSLEALDVGVAALAIPEMDLTLSNIFSLHNALLYVGMLHFTLFALQ